VGVRRAHEHEPRLAGKLAVVAVETAADEQPLVLEPLLRARRAEARGRRIELDLQGRRGQRENPEKEIRRRGFILRYQG
jgi:hypothetical protein